MINFPYKKEKGFTLIEMIVAMALFVIVIMAVITAFVFTLRAQRVAIAEKEVAENLDFAVEYMTRQMRTGVRSEPGGPYGGMEAGCSANLPQNADDDIFHIENSGRHVRFLTTAQSNPVVQCKAFEINNDGAIILIEDYGGSATTTELTDSSVVEIDDIVFSVRGQQRGGEQPRITFSIKGRHLGSAQEGSAGEFETQTTVSTRALDVE